MNLFHDEYAEANAPLRLSYHGACHYNALLDPQAPSIGVGLGLPGPAEPKAADQAHLQTAIRDSEQHMAEEQLAEFAKSDSEAALVEQQLLAKALEQSRADSDMSVLEQQLLAEALQSSRTEFYADALASAMAAKNRKASGGKSSKQM